MNVPLFLTYSVPLLLIGAFLCTLVVMPVLIPFLKRLKFGQSIREDGPTWHNGKKGTPTMGGIGMMIGMSIPIFVIFAINKGSIGLLVAYVMALSFGFIGFVDDYIKVVKKRNLGLNSKQKIMMQILATVAYLATLNLLGLADTSMTIPYFGYTLDIGILYYPVAMFIIIGAVNSVNLTDGLDGLATCVTIPVALSFIAIGYSMQHPDLIHLSTCLLGTLCAFLVFNRYPAKVFMGDTGSFFIGGMVVALAFLINMPILLLFCGLVYVVEALSDIIQIGYFKMTRGKRFFKMAPLHHHFEMCGWNENKIVAVFTTISAIMCVISYFLVTKIYV